MACCEHTCNNIALNQFAANILSIPGLVSPEIMLKFQNQVKLTTGLDIKLPDWVKEAKQKKIGAGIAPSKEEAGSKKLEKVKGYVMKEKKDEKASELPTSGISIAAILIVIFIVALIGGGLWKGMRR